MLEKIMRTLLVAAWSLIAACGIFGWNAVNADDAQTMDGGRNGAFAKESDFAFDGTTITGYTGNAQNVVIPPTIHGRKVLAIGKNAFAGKTMTSVSIPESVKTIGFGAFKGCTSLTSVTIPKGVKTIESSAFFDCTRLTSVTIPNSVEAIRSSAFFHCTGLTSVTIPDSVKTIEDQVFLKCIGLTSVTIPGSVEWIGWQAFAFCTGLTSVIVNPGVGRIERDAFKGDTSLTTVILPERAMCIFGGVNVVFPDCPSLQSVVYKDVEEEIKKGDDLMAAAPRDVAAGVKANENAKPKNGNANSDFDFDGTTITGYTGNAQELVIPSMIRGQQVRIIGERAFAGRPILSVFIPNTVTEIRRDAFIDCNQLQIVTIPGSVITIGRGAFCNCRVLKSVIVEDGVLEIGMHAFLHCISLTTVTLPRSVKVIGRQAFHECLSLKRLRVPKHLKGYFNNWSDRDKKKLYYY